MTENTQALARHLAPGDLSDYEEREFVIAGGVLLQMVFDLDHERCCGSSASIRTTSCAPTRTGPSASSCRARWHGA